jgi:serine/threonine-protein kinase
VNLQQGTRLGPYEINGPVGAGGMGQVYRATDSRLGRSVAVKVIPEHLAGREDLRARFEREAKVVSQLNHPHICTLHDVGETDIGGSSVHYIVMELLEGETLADRTARGPLPLDQVIRFAMQIADALDRAHRSGVIHRDLKPGNIMITSGGVKLLDFGLAKTFGRSSTDSLSPTAHALTSDNVIVGTLQYMSPEQISGGVVDARSDIFSFGAVLYEMITGRRPFGGATQPSIAAAIVRDDPPSLSELRPLLPADVGRIVGMCLAKDPEERFQNARDVMLMLRSVGAAVAQPAVRPQRRWLALAAAAGIAVGALLVYGLVRPPPVVARSSRHLSVEVTPPLQLVPNGFGAPFDISPDGSQIAWSGVESTTSMLYLRSLDSPEIRRIAGSDHALQPFFSQDGQSIGFFGEGQIRVASLRGDALVRSICEAGPGVGGTWLDDQTIVFAGLPGGGLMRVSVSGGKPQEFTSVETSKGEAGHAWPHALPGTQTVLFSIEREGQSWDHAQIAAYSFDTKEKRIILDGGTRPRYADGKLYYASGNRLLSVGFDREKLTLTGSPTVVMDHVVTQPGTGGSFFALSAGGTIVYKRGNADFFATRVLARSPAGPIIPFDVPLRTYANPRVSHDGTQLALQLVSANDDLWVLHRTRRTFTRVTAQGENLFPNWSPDGKSFLVSSILNGSNLGLMTVQIASASPTRPLLPDLREDVQLGTSWSPSGRIAFTVLGARGSDIYLLDRIDGAPRPFLQTRFNEHEASLSPDGRFIAYSSDESGTSEIYLRAVDRPAEKLQVSVSGGREPLWSRDGRRLYYRQGRGFLVADMTIIDGSPAAGTPRLLFEGDFVEGTEANGYDVGPDGTFVLLQRNGSAGDGGFLQIRFAG